MLLRTNTCTKPDVLRRRRALASAMLQWVLDGRTTLTSLQRVKNVTDVHHQIPVMFESRAAFTHLSKTWNNDAARGPFSLRSLVKFHRNFLALNCQHLCNCRIAISLYNMLYEICSVIWRRVSMHSNSAEGLAEGAVPCWSVLWQLLVVLSLGTVLAICSIWSTAVSQYWSVIWNKNQIKTKETERISRTKFNRWLITQGAIKTYIE